MSGIDVSAVVKGVADLTKSVSGCVEEKIKQDGTTKRTVVQEDTKRISDTFNFTINAVDSAIKFVQTFSTANNDRTKIQNDHEAKMSKEDNERKKIENDLIKTRENLTLARDKFLQNASDSKAVYMSGLEEKTDFYDRFMKIIEADPAILNSEGGKEIMKTMRNLDNGITELTKVFLQRESIK